MPPCSDRPGGPHPRTAAAGDFAAGARNQSQELRSRRRNQTQLKPPESRGFRPPSTLLADFASVERLIDDGYRGDGAGEPQPPQLGPYRPIRRLGDGAFGEVFLCEQLEPVRREVAVKVLRPGVGDRTTLQRFAVERQLIASLQHPAIAQVFDAGTLPDGRPFFVMDAIDGAPIDRYCDDRALTVDARIDLFCDLCRGVQHAHERGIVHRDLKPANVLVVTVDGRPRPKVIDFGIAKVLQHGRVAQSIDTEAGRVIGTPGYMSPEQQRGASVDADARADVFSLGVMLYELLCGQLPWSIGAAATDTDPARPSTRVSTSSGTTNSVARDRSTQPRRLANRLRGDLDWIVLKCLNRDPGLRYRSAQELVDDLERHRRAEPVQAGPPSTTYRLRKFVRRHRTFTVAVGSAVAVVAMAIVWTASIRATFLSDVHAANTRAETSFAAAASAIERLVARADDAAVREAPEGDAAREAMLREALTFYDRFLAERPSDPVLRSQRSAAMARLAHFYWSLGDGHRADACATAAREEASALVDAEPADPDRQGLLGEALQQLGNARSLLGDDAEARRAFAAAIDNLAAGAVAVPHRWARPHAIAVRSAALASPSRPERLTRLRSSLGELQALVTSAPEAETAREFVITACELGEELNLANELAESETVLQAADAQLASVTSERAHLAYRIAILRANIAFAGGERRATLAHYRAALAAVVGWEQAQPNRLQPRTLHMRALRHIGYAQNYSGDFDDSVASYRAAVAIGEELALRYAKDADRSRELAAILEEFAVTLLDRFDRRVLDEAAQCAERALQVETRVADDATATRLWPYLGLRATIADARAADGGDPFWPAVAASLQIEPVANDREADDLVGLYVSLARWHLDHDRSELARPWLQRANAAIARAPTEHRKREVEVAWLTARIAFAAGDHLACAAAAERALAARPTWYGRRRAGDCLHLAWCAARRDPATAAAAATYAEGALAAYRAVRAALDADVAQNPHDPWFVMPWGVAGIRLAQILQDTDPAGASETLRAVIAALDGVRSTVPEDQWDAAAYRDGQDLQTALAARPR